MLKKIRYGESDLIVHFLLESNVILKGFAPGARHSSRRYPHRFDLSGVYRLDSSVKPEPDRLVRLGHVELVEYAAGFRGDFSLMSRWSMILEWIAHETVETHSFLDLLKLRDDLQNNHLESFHQFFWRIIAEEGIAPAEDSCAICHRHFEKPDRTFASHGYAHRNCSVGRVLLPETQRWISAELRFKEQSEPFGPAVLEDLDEITLPYLQQQLGRVLKSFEFFRQLRFGTDSFQPAQSSSVSLQKEV